MKLTKIVLAVAAMFMLACSSDGGSNGGSSNGGGNNSWGESGSVIGAWELTSFNEGGEARPRIYMALYENNTFDLYQQYESVEWLHYKGTFTFDGTLLSGEYQDGKAWGNAYSVEFANNPARLRLTCSNGTESYIYTAVEEIPQTILEMAKEPTAGEATATRSVEIKRFL